MTAMTRDEALRLGLHKYIDITPCKRGHDSFKYTSSGACVACATAAAKRFNEKKHAAVIEIKVRVLRGDEEAVINTAKALAAMRGFSL
jgi:hypothetical protein